MGRRRDSHAHGHDRDDHDEHRRPPHRCAARPRVAGRHRRAGREREDRAGRGACAASLSDEMSVAVVTNDIFTTEDAAILERTGVLAAERIVGVQTGCCPHTAIRDDISENVDALDDARGEVRPRRRVPRERGRQPHRDVQPRARRRPDLRDRRGRRRQGPAQGWSGHHAVGPPLINKTDLAPLVGSDLDVMARDAAAMRGDRPTMFVSLTEDPMATAVADWVRAEMAVGARSCEDQRRSLVRAPRRRGGRRPHAVHDDAIVAAHHPADDPRRGVPGRERGRSARRRSHSAAGRRRAPGARLVVRSAAATIALPGATGGASTAAIDLRVRAGGALCWLLEPMLLAKGCDHRTTTRIRLDPGSALVFREVVVLGRHQEASGSLVPGHPRRRRRTPVAPEHTAARSALARTPTVPRESTTHVRSRRRSSSAPNLRRVASARPWKGCARR